MGATRNAVNASERPAEAMPDDPALLADHCLARAAWQRMIFAPRLRRRELLELVPTWPCRPVHVAVLRNQPFEFVGSVLSAFGAFAGLDIRLRLGDYDDSLANLDVSSAEAVVVWLDWTRYHQGPDEIAAWLAGRLSAIREVTDAPVLVHDAARAGEGFGPNDLNAALHASVAAVPGAFVVPQDEIAAGLGAAYLDERAARITGFELSDAACLETARALGLRWLPAALGAGIRAVIVDLDGTLYEGVLGEDGSSGVRVEAGHRTMAERLLELRDRGVFLGLVSMNEPEDVAELFTRRQDVPLRMEHFSVRSIGWEPKGPRLQEMIRRLRIGPETVLFVDDNPGELAAAAGQIPGLQCLWADPADPDATNRALRWYPGLEKLASTDVDSLRVADLEAAEQRGREQRASKDPAAYLRSLGIELTLAEDSLADLPRLRELSMKTNQFNTTLSRLSEEALAARMADPESRVISASLRDRLSDSGLIAAMVCSRRDSRVVVEEMAMSCRALGRGVETPLALAALRRVVAELASNTVVFPFTAGPRNEAARRWLEAFTGEEPSGLGQASIEWDEAEADARLGEAPVVVRWADHP